MNGWPIKTIEATDRGDWRVALTGGPVFFATDDDLATAGVLSPAGVTVTVGGRSVTIPPDEVDDLVETWGDSEPDPDDEPFIRAAARVARLLAGEG